MERGGLPGWQVTLQMSVLQVWCGTVRPEAAVKMIRTSAHSPGRFRSDPATCQSVPCQTLPLVCLSPVRPCHLSVPCQTLPLVCLSPVRPCHLSVPSQTLYSFTVYTARSPLNGQYLYFVHAFCKRQLYYFPMSVFE